MEILAGFRNLSKRSLYGRGSRSVIQLKNAIRLQAALHLQGHTGIQLFLAQLI
jgi:hypothetical protein